MSIDWRPLSSSAISAAGYDAARKQLHIRFRSGPPDYTFCGVPEHVFVGLVLTDTTIRGFLTA